MPRRKRKGPVRRTLHNWQEVLIKAEPEDLDENQDLKEQDEENLGAEPEKETSDAMLEEKVDTAHAEAQTTKSLNGDSPDCEDSSESAPDASGGDQSADVPPQPSMMFRSLAKKFRSLHQQTPLGKERVKFVVHQDPCTIQFPRRKSNGPQRRNIEQTTESGEISNDPSINDPLSLQSHTDTSPKASSLEEDISRRTPPHPTLMFVKLPHTGASQVVTRSINIDDGGISETDDDNFLDVSCGELQGRLHKNKFYCPGIHKECIELDDHMMTPKQFAYLGGKANLKDWKNAIRVGGMKLRKYMEAGYLQFYQHDQFCTFRCAGSVIPNNPGQRSAKPDVPLQVTAVTTIKEHTYSVLPDHSEGRTLKRGGALGNGPEGAEESPQKRIKLMSSNEISNSDIEDHMFWKGIVDLGLADEFFREIKSSLDGLKNTMIKKFVPMEEAKVLTRVVTRLGLMNKLKHRLAAHKFEMERQQHKLDREMEELKRRVSEYEHKKEMLKKKSECFDNLMVMSQVKKEQTSSAPPSPKPLNKQGGDNIIMVMKRVKNEKNDKASTSTKSEDQTSQSEDKLIVISQVKTVESDSASNSPNPPNKMADTTDSSTLANQKTVSVPSPIQSQKLNKNEEPVDNSVVENQETDSSANSPLSDSPSPDGSTNGSR